MLQVASFRLPEEQKEANEFLATHKPSHQGVNFAENTLHVFYEDYARSVHYEIAELRSLMEDVKAAMLQQEIALFTMQNERDTLNHKNNKGRYETLSSQITDIGRSMDLQKHKIAFLEGKIAELQGDHEEKDE